MKEAEKFISSIEVIKRFGISYSTLTHYTNLGLLIVSRKKSNKRLYQKGEVGKRLAKIRKLSSKGYPLKIIKKILANGAAK